MPESSNNDLPPGNGISVSSFIRLLVQKFITYKDRLMNILMLKSPPEPLSAYNQTESTLLKLSEENHNIKNHLFSSFISFTNKTVEEVMTPRSDITAVKWETNLEELNNCFLKCGHARILIYKKNLDNIIGFINVKDVFEVIALQKKYDLNSLIRKHIVCPKTMKLVDLLAHMQRSCIHIAVVVDEYGGTDGIVTIGDITGEVFGKIEDERNIDVEIKNNYQIIKPGVIISSARVEIEIIEDIIGVKLKSAADECETIGGLIIARMGRIPLINTVIEIAPGIVAEILDSTPRMIKQMKIRYKPLLKS